MKYFWREKNADYYKGQYKLVVPSEQELFDELRNKFIEKLSMIDVVFDKGKRKKYLVKKNKQIPEGTPEIIIQQKIGTRVIVDFLQLIKDVCKIKHVSIEIQKKYDIKSPEEIYKSINEAIKGFNINLKSSLAQIKNSVDCLINILALEGNQLEQERQKVEEKEGSFAKGKIVLM